MTVQYGDPSITNSQDYGYGDLHPAMQRHLSNLQDTVNKQTTTPYGEQPYTTNPTPQPVNQINQPEQPGQTTLGNNTPENMPNQAQTPGQIPDATALKGVAAGGSSDSPAGSPGATGLVKPNPIGSVGGPVPMPTDIDTSDIDNIGRQANLNMSSLASMHQAQLAEQARQNAYGQASQYNPQTGQMGTGGLRLNQNMSIPGFDNEQVNNARAIIQEGLARGLPRQNIEAAVMAGLTESSLRNLAGGDRDSAGLFQMRPSQGWGSYAQVTDPNYEIAKFYDTMAGIQGGSSMTPWMLDQSIERSAFSDGSNYLNNYGLAKQLVDGLVEEAPQGQIAAPTMAPSGALNWISQNTGKYLDFDGWYGAQCVDLYDFYCTGFVGAAPIPVGYAQEIWWNHDTNAFTQIASNQATQMGDVAVWGNGPYTPMSHVGIVIADNGDGTLKTLSNNATSAGSTGAAAVVNISKAALLGYLRPKNLM